MSVSTLSVPTPELGLEQCQNSDDTADYLTIALANSLLILDALFNGATGHTHGGAHQGGPIGSIPPSAIPDGSITSAKIADGTIASVDLADGSVVITKLAAGSVTTPAIAANVTLTSPTINNPVINGANDTGSSFTMPSIANPTITGVIAGGGVFNNGPYTTDWFRVNTAGQGLFNTPAGCGIGFDAGGPIVYGAYGGGHLISETAAQTLSNKTLTSPAINTPTITTPTLNGTVNGQPTWTSPQTFPVGTIVGTRRAVGSQNANNWVLDSGSTGVLSCPTGGSVFTIGFTTAFSAAPDVVANVQGVSGGQNTAHVTWWTGNATTSTFQLFVNNGSGGGQSLECSWHAFGR